MASGKSTSTTTEYKSNQYDPWVTQSGQDVFNTALSQVQNNPWQGYGGPTSADFGQDWYSASGQLNDLAGQPNQNLGAASGSLQQILGTLDPSKSIQDYMNPYMDQVLAPTITAINKANEQQTRNLGAQATMAGAFGDSAHGVQQALQEGQRQQAIGAATGSAYDKAWTQAAGLKEAELNNLFKTITGLTTTGNAQFGQDTELAKLLASLGTQQQQAGQTGIQNDIALNLQDQTMPTQQMTSLAQILAMLPKNTQGYGTSQTSSPDNSGLAMLMSLI